MANNEFSEKRVAVFPMTAAIGTAATTVSAGVYVPAGAIVNKIVALVTGAQTNRTDASGTFQLRVGTNPIGSSQTWKQLGAQTIATRLALLTTAGVFVAANGELNLIMGQSANSSYDGPPTFYVEYMMS